MSCFLRTFSNINTRYLLIITLIYLIASLLMLPLRNTAYDDDFAYIRTVERLDQTGRLEISEWAAVSLIFQAYWGELFYKVFGPHITSLHASNIFLLYFGIISFFLTLKKLGCDNFRSFIFSLFLFFYPWIFNFSYSFMSDTFYVSLSLIALYFIISGLKDKSNIYLLIGSTFTGLAFLTRQIAISIFIALIFLQIYKFFICKNKPFKETFTLTFPFTIIFLYYFVQLKINGPTAAYASYVIYPITHDLLPYILPFRLGFVAITNSLYQEIFVQRGMGYLNTLAGFSLPIFLIFYPSLTSIRKFILNNYIRILGIGVIFIIFYYTDSLLKNKFTTTFSVLITRNDIIFIDWTYWWKFIVYISIPFWLLLISGFSKNLSNFLETKKHPFTKTFKLIIYLEVITVFVIFFLTYRASYPNQFVFRPADTITQSLFSTIHALAFSETTFKFVKDTWFFFLFIVTVFTLIIFFLCYKNIRLQNQKQQIISFLILALFIQIFFVLVLANFFWEQYIIQIIPLIYLITFYYLRNVRINKPLAVLLILLYATFTINLTRYRYQVSGSSWEIAASIVAKGTNPYQINEVTWAWRPYWFFEETFAEAVKQNGGDKYQTARKKFTNWNQNPVQGDFYDIKAVDINYQPDEEKIILESQPYWLIEKKRITWKKSIAIYYDK